MDRSDLFDDLHDRGTQTLPLRMLLDDHYEVGRVLGVGGFGITYAAWDVRLQTAVAIKEYLPRGLATRLPDRSTVAPHAATEAEAFETGLASFLAEARTLARFNHPNIVRVRNFFEGNGTGYLVMDFLEGVTLKHYLLEHGGKLAEEKALDVMLAVLDGLRAVHAQGVLHRDVKPANIYLTTAGRPVLLDFGAARMKVSEQTHSLSMVLTPGYAPFEQYQRRGEQGPWTDVYASAATLYHVVTGVAPPEATERITHDTLAPADTWEPALSARLCGALAQGLAMRPEDRPQTIEAFAALLKDPAPPPDAPSIRAAVQSDVTALAGRPSSRRTARDAAPPLETSTSQGAAGAVAASRQPPAPAEASASRPGVPARPVWRRPRVVGAVAGVALLVLVVALWSSDGSPAVDDVAETLAGQPVTLSVLANDRADAALPWRIESVGLPANGATRVDGDTTITYTPAPGFTGDDTFSYTATDGARSATARVTVHVRARDNEPPAAMPDHAQTEAGQAVVVAVLDNDSDADGDSLRLEAVGEPAHGTVQVLQGGRVWYHPFAGFLGQDSLVYTLHDGRGARARGILTVSVGEELTPEGLYQRGEAAGRIGRRAEALRWYERAADAGHAPAQHRLGTFYQRGQGVAADVETAVRFFKEAAAQGHAPAMGSLGLAYRQGEGVPRDPTEALTWWRRGAQAGDPLSLFGLGQLYEAGEGVPRDETEAMRWYRQAAERGHAEARRALERLTAS